MAGTRRTLQERKEILSLTYSHTREKKDSSTSLRRLAGSTPTGSELRRELSSLFKKKKGKGRNKVGMLVCILHTGNHEISLSTTHSQWPIKIWKSLGICRCFCNGSYQTSKVLKFLNQFLRKSVRQNLSQRSRSVILYWDQVLATESLLMFLSLVSKRMGLFLP